MKRPTRKKTASEKHQPLVGEIVGLEYGRLLAEIRERIRSAQTDFIERNTTSTVHSCLYFRAVSRADSAMLVVNHWDRGRGVR